MQEGLINYYLDCYQADSRTVLFSDIFDRSISLRHFIETKEELINGIFPKIHIPSEEAIEILAEQQLKGNGVDLYYCSFFVTGIMHSFQNVEKKVCAPLCYFPAEIRKEGEEGFHYIYIDKARMQINFSFLQRINKKESTNLYQDIQALKAESIGIGSLHKIKSLLEKHIENIITDDMFQFPELITLKELKSSMRIDKLRKQDAFKVVSSSCLCLMDHQEKTSGILNELKRITEKTPSALLKKFFTLTPEYPKPAKHALSTNLVPGILNEEQNQLISSIDQSKQHILIGPPGTGKSYSIAALAIDHIARGKSVLISSKNADALKVIARKIENDFGVKEIIVKAEKRSYKTFLKKKTNHILKNIKHKEHTKLATLHSQLRSLEKEIKTLSTRFRSANSKAYSWGANLSKEDPNWMDQLYQKVIAFRTKRQTTHWELTNQLYAVLKKRNQIIKRIIRRKTEDHIKRSITDDYENTKLFYELLKTSDFYKKEALRTKIDFKKILAIFPVWLVPLDELHEVLPLENELFDLLIIDEASQCNVSSCIPALARTKKLILSGDPAQLKHFSFLSKDMMNAFRVKQNLPLHSILNYRKNSILDFALFSTAPNSIYQLKEHFRSLAPIIEFSKQHFYDNTLVLMTETPDKNTEDVLQFYHCKGSRDKHGVNEQEGLAIVEMLKKIIENQIIKDIPQSIGVLSPISAQVKYIKDLINQEIDYNDIKRHNISIGTAFQFQGDERDCMLISLCITPDCKSGTFTHLNKADFFNVSITRARYQQKIFHSINSNEVPEDHLLRAYLSIQTKNKTAKSNSDTEIRDLFARDVNKAVKALALECFEQYPIAGIQIDILLQKGKKYLAIDLIGFPGAYHDAFDLKRYMLMYRLNIPILPLSYSDWYFDKEKAMQQIKHYF